MTKTKKSVVFTLPSGKVVAIKRVTAYVEKDVLMVEPAAYRKFNGYFAFWRGLHYQMRPIAV